MHLSHIIQATLLYSIVEPASALPIHADGGKHAVSSFQNKRAFVIERPPPVIADHIVSVSPASLRGDGAVTGAVTASNHIGMDTAPGVGAQACGHLKTRSWTKYLIGMVSKRMCQTSTGTGDAVNTAPTGQTQQPGSSHFSDSDEGSVGVAGEENNGGSQAANEENLVGSPVDNPEGAAGPSSGEVDLGTSVDGRFKISGTPTNSPDITEYKIKATGGAHATIQINTNAKSMKVRDAIIRDNDGLRLDEDVSLADFEKVLWTENARMRPNELNSIEFETVIQGKTEEIMTKFSNAPLGDEFIVTSASTGIGKNAFDELSQTPFGKNALKLNEKFGVERPIKAIQVQKTNLIISFVDL